MGLNHNFFYELKYFMRYESFWHILKHSKSNIRLELKSHLYSVNLSNLCGTSTNAKRIITRFEWWLFGGFIVRNDDIKVVTTDVKGVLFFS